MTLRERILYSRPVQLAGDTFVVAFSLVFAYLVRFDGVPPEAYQRQLWIVLPGCVAVYIGVNHLCGIHSFIWRFTSLKEVLAIARAVAITATLLLLFRLFAYSEFLDGVRVPFGVLLVHPMLTYIGLVGIRTLRRVQYHYQLRHRYPGTRQLDRRRVLVVGAGEMGQLLVRELEHNPNYEVCGFIDDDPRKHGRVIHGIRVLGPTAELEKNAREHGVGEVILSMPTAPTPVLRKIVTSCREAGIGTSSVPSMAEIVSGEVPVGQLRPVRMEDLLGRALVEYPADDDELIQSCRDRRILITGAGGSIGWELARQLKDFKPSHLILVDRDENNLYEACLEIREEYAAGLVEIVADIRDRGRVDKIFDKWKPEVIFHAAAYKHVPLMENHPSEAILANVIGTRHLVEAAAAYQARSFVLISTDKAVNPTSVMGASKRLAEMIVQRAAAQDDNSTRFCAVRFGNVLGSRASVVPLFQKRIAQGKSLTVTHPDMRRYFMTIPEAVQLVIQAGSLGQHGEILVLDMGNPVKIVDLARKLIQLSGLEPDKDIRIEYSGLRPGEKLYEELLVSSENGTRNTRYSKIFVVDAARRDWDGLEEVVVRLEKAARDEDFNVIYQVLESLDIGYQPSASVPPVVQAIV
jgi:FlaA1/EpsC-like NDP-sugar epimerase